MKPDHAYYFVIKDSRSVGNRFWFKTAPDKPKPFTFIVGADTKSKGEELKMTRLSTRMVAKLRPLFVVFSGDYTSGDGTSAEDWKLWFDDWMEITTTADDRMIPLIPVHGNHENGQKDILHQLFDTPCQGNNKTNIYYDITIGGNLLSIIALNTEIETGGDQTAWLEESLKRNRNSTFKMTLLSQAFLPAYIT